MKIGILTLPFNNNYGGYLQAIALMEVLKQLGHNPTIISRRRNKPSFKRKIHYFLLGIRGLLIPSKRQPFFLDNEKVFYHRGCKMIPFVDRYLQPRTPSLFSYSQIEQYGSQFDAYIVGSDQVWRPIYVPDIKEFFFSFVKEPDSRKIAYAASFGTNDPEFSEEDKEECKRLIKTFSAVSLREESGKTVFNKLGFSYDRISVVLDPTMLLPTDFYYSIMGTCKSKSCELFCYILNNDEMINKLIKIVSSDMKVLPYYILDKNWERKKYIMPSIEEWLCGIANAKFIVTDSYHGTVFSILFNKEFITIGNKRRGNDRFFSLLNKFGLLDRFVLDSKNFSDAYSKKINWKSVNNILANERVMSIQFLKNSLSVMSK